MPRFSHRWAIPLFALGAGACKPNNVAACNDAGDAATAAFADCDLGEPSGGATCESTYEDVGSCDYTAYFECLAAAANAADLGDCSDYDALTDYTTAISDCDPNPVDCGDYPM